MAKVLLTGAAGSVGFETLKQLVEAGHQVTALDIKSTHSSRKLRPYQSSSRIVYGDVRDRALVRELVEGKDVVIHLAALIPPAADRNPELTREINYGGTQNIVDAIAEQEGKRTFLVFASSVSVYGDRTKNYWIKTTDLLRPSEGDYYAAMKIKSEQYIERAKIDWTIFRLTAIMNRPQTDPLMFHMPLETKLEIATVYDTARAFVAAIDHQAELRRHIYNLSGGEQCRTTYCHFLIEMFKIYGLQFKYLRSVAFAKRNFHCGYFRDSDKLEAILHFRRNTLRGYYAIVDRNTNKFARLLARIFSRPIIFFLMLKSEPLQAVKKHDRRLIERFFGKDKQGKERR